MRLPQSSPLLAALLLSSTVAWAEPVDISADRAVAPPRSDPGTGLCVSAVHLKDDGLMANVSDGLIRLDLNVGDAGVDGKVSGLRFPALNFRNAAAGSAGDLTGDGTQESLFPYSADPTARPPGNDTNFALRGRALLNISKAGLYTVGVNAQAGFRLTLGGLLVTRSPSGQSGHFSQQLRFAAPGLYPIEIIHYTSRAVGAGTVPPALLEVSLAEGAQAEVSASANAFDPAIFLRVGSASLYSASVSEGNCQECADDASCGSGSFCGSLKLCQLCLSDDRCGLACKPCPGAQPFCSSGQCVECTSERDGACTAKKQVCKALTSTCGPCTDSLECKGQICRGDGTCGPCQVDGQCPDNQLCDAAAGLCYTRLCSDSNRDPCTEKGQICNVDRGLCRGCNDDTECLALSSTLQCDQGAKRCVARRDLRYKGGCSVGAESGDASTSLLGVVALCLLLLSVHAARGLRRARHASVSLRPRAARRRRPQAGVVALLLLLLAPAARAQVALNAQTFRPTMGPENVITVDGTRTPGHLTPAASLVFDFAYRPLRLFDATAGLFVANTVPSMATAHAQLGIGLSRFFFIGASLPIVVYQGFDNGTAIVDPRVTAPAPFGLGDLRVLAKVRFLDNQDHGFGLALAPQVSFPTGQGGAFRGDDSFDIEPRLVADYKFRQGTFIALNAGFQARTADQVLLDNRFALPAGAQSPNLVRISHQVRYGIGVYAPIAKGLGVGGEVQGGTSLATADNGDRYMPLEGAALVRYAHKGGFNVSVGGGGAFIGGPGIPLFRAFASIGYVPIGRPLTKAKPKVEAPPPVDPDPDGDGVLGADDRCPDQAGPAESRGCPYLDSDGDGLLDKLDQCPKEAGPLAYRGCPEGKADRDGDGVLDKDDACPEEAGVAQARGCPAAADRDKDGVADKDDRCPEQAGVADNGGCPDLDSDGDGLVDRLDKCPKEAGAKDAGGCPAPAQQAPAQQAPAQQAPGALTVGEDGAVKLAQPLRFAPGGAALDPASAPVVAALAKLVQGDASVKKVQIAVPTSGDKKVAKKLGGQRVKALGAALAAAGLPKKLLAVKPGKGLAGDAITQVQLVKGKAKGKGKGKKK